MDEQSTGAPGAASGNSRHIDPRGANVFRSFAESTNVAKLGVSHMRTGRQLRAIDLPTPHHHPAVLGGSQVLEEPVHSAPPDSQRAYLTSAAP
jgi:hypothetical protein